MGGLLHIVYGTLSSYAREAMCVAFESAADHAGSVLGYYAKRRHLARTFMISAAHTRRSVRGAAVASQYCCRLVSSLPVKNDRLDNFKKTSWNSDYRYRASISA